MSIEKAWKDVLTHLFPEFMEFFFPWVVADIDFTCGYQFLDKEFQQIVRESEKDLPLVNKLVEVCLKNGEKIWVLIYINLQKEGENDFAQQVNIYFGRIFYVYRKFTVCLAVLTDRDPGYRPNRYGTEFSGFQYVLEFPVVKIMDYVPEEVEKKVRENPFALCVLAYLRTWETEGADEERYRWKKKYLLQLYELNMEKEAATALFQFVDCIMELPEEMDRQLLEELYKVEKDKGLSTLSSKE